MDMSIDPSMVDKSGMNALVGEELGTQDDQAIKRVKAASSIEKAAQGAQEKQVLASNPQLTFPLNTMISDDVMNDLKNIAALTGTGQSSATDAYVAMRMSEIASNIAGQMADTAAEQAEKMPELNRQSRALAQEREKRLEEIRLGQQEHGASNAGKNAVQKADGAKAALAALGIVATVAMPGAQIVSNNAVQPLVTASGVVQVIIPTNVEPAVSVLVAFFGGTAVTKAALFSLKKAGQGEAKINREFVDKHSKQTIANVNNPKLTQSLQNILSTPKADGTTLSEKEVNEKIAMVKLTMLFNALALGYKAEAGHVTSEELAALLKGDMQFPDGDSRNLLVDQILLFLPQLSKPTRAAFLLKYFNYLEDEQPSTKGFQEPVTALHSMFASPIARPSAAA